MYLIKLRSKDWYREGRNDDNLKWGLLKVLLTLLSRWL